MNLRASRLMRVYHFLSAEFALSNIALQRMRVSRLADLNDPFELLAVDVGGRKDLRMTLAAWKKELHESKGLLCFSKDWRNPVLWSHYAAKHRGMALGFEIPDDTGKEIQYSTERIAAHIASDGSFKPDEAFVQTLLYTKYSHWAYEEEVRVFVELDKKTVEGGLYFVPFSPRLKLCHVVLGPLCEIPIERVRTLVAKTCQSVHVDKGRLAFKWFKVVQDERFKRKALA